MRNRTSRNDDPQPATFRLNALVDSPVCDQCQPSIPLGHNSSANVLACLLGRLELFLSGALVKFDLTACRR